MNDAIWGSVCHEQVSESLGSVLAYAELSQVKPRRHFNVRLMAAFGWGGRDMPQSSRFWSCINRRCNGGKCYEHYSV